MKSCIYQILNILNGKFYIGHTQDYEVRWFEHERCLRKNRHENYHLQQAWNKYGASTFEFIIIELVEKEDMLVREQFWIDSLDACDKNIGYNINPDALRPPLALGRIKSKETRAKISAATTGIPKRSHTRIARTDEHKKNLSFAKRANSDWPCLDGYSCNCNVCRPRRNRMKNYPNIYGNPNSKYYKQ